MAQRDSVVREPALGPAEAVAEQLAEGLAAEAAPARGGSPEGCVSWVPWTGRSTPR